MAQGELPQQHTTARRVLYALIAPVAAYAAASWAIDSGSMWAYGATIVAVYATVRFTTAIIMNYRSQETVTTRTTHTNQTNSQES